MMKALYLAKPNIGWRLRSRQAELSVLAYQAANLVGAFRGLDLSRDIALQEMTLQFENIVEHLWHSFLRNN